VEVPVFRHSVTVCGVMGALYHKSEVRVKAGLALEQGNEVLCVDIVNWVLGEAGVDATTDDEADGVGIRTTVVEHFELGQLALRQLEPDGGLSETVDFRARHHEEHLAAQLLQDGLGDFVHGRVIYR
jgi:hypothetical protein